MLIGGLVACALIATLAIVWWELRSAALNAATERLSVITEQLGTALDRTTAARHELYRDVAAHADVVGLLVASPGSSVAAARAQLERLRGDLHADLPIVLVNAGGRPITAAGSVPAAEITRSVRRGNEITYGSIEPTADGFAYWVSIPVRSGGSIFGHVLQQRAGASTTAAAQIEALLGDDIALHVANRDGGAWVALDAQHVSGTPARVDTLRAFTYDVPDDGQILAFARPLQDTPWYVIAQMPMASVTALANAALRRIGLFGTLLLALGLISAWLVSRSVTRPLRRLGRAADAIAAGDYSRRARFDRSDEIGLLARSFDAMAAHIDATHAQLEQRFRQAQSLAAELELANSRLTQAIRDAEAARRDAQHASTVKGEFLATMSHEIRTPINAIIGYTDLMDMKLPGPLTREQEDYVRRIRLSGEHLISLVNDVLDFAKIESGQMRIAQETVAVRRVIDAAITMLQGPARARRIRLGVGGTTDLMFCGDAQRAQQILLNLLSNALKFTAEGGRIDVLCERRESRGLREENGTATTWTCISVRDTGAGIPADQLEAIFEPFVQGVAGYTRTHGGTGLGLAISRSLARMMNGDLTVESEPGAGSTFTVWLPHSDVPVAAH